MKGCYLVVPGVLFEQQRQGVGFFARAAPRAPDAEGVLRIAAAGQVGDHFGAQDLERRRVAKKPRHPDQEFLVEQLRFLGAIGQQVDVRFDPVQLFDQHSLFDAAQQGRAPVVPKVYAGVLRYVLEDGFQVGTQLVVLAVEQQQPVFFTLKNGIQRLGDSGRRQHLVGNARLDSGLRHPVELGRIGVLHQHDASVVFNRLDAAAAVRAGTG